MRHQDIDSSVNDNHNGDNTINYADEKHHSCLDYTDNLIERGIRNEHNKGKDGTDAKVRIDHNHPVKKSFSFLFQDNFHDWSIERDNE